MDEWVKLLINNPKLYFVCKSKNIILIKNTNCNFYHRPEIAVLVEINPDLFIIYIKHWIYRECNLDTKRPVPQPTVICENISRPLSVM